MNTQVKTQSPGERGYKPRRGSYLHIQIAERALGKPLPAGAVVHHIDLNPRNNSTNNLVVCPSQKYHFLLHRRQRALNAGYPAHYLRCNACKQYGNPTEMYVYEKKGSAVHVSCQFQINQARRAA